MMTLLPPVLLAAALHGRTAPLTRPVIRMSAGIDSKTAFEQWADKSGITAPSLHLEDFDGVRGVSATKELQPNERVLAVPSKLALQVTTAQRAPDWSDEAVWRKAPWHHRLALTLLHAESEGASSLLRPWLSELPTKFTTPIFWSEEELHALGYPPLVDAVQKQRAEWDALHGQMRSLTPGELAADRDAVYRALSVVRSRSFSGPYASGTFRGSLITLFAACTLAGLVAIGGGNAELALDGFLGVTVYVLANDLFFSRATNEKRYVLCPFIDMMNHESARAATDVSYEYFSDCFAVVLDGRHVKQGRQANICYGPQSNDALLQYYGFVEPANPHDKFVISVDAFLIELAAAAEFDPVELRSLAALKLPDAIALTRKDAGEEMKTVVRMLLYPESAAASKGRVPLALEQEVGVMRALAATAKRFSARMAPAGSGVGFAEPPPAVPAKKGAKGKQGKRSAGAKAAAAAPAAELAFQFRAEKSRLLASAADALLARAQASEAAGEVIEPEIDAAASPLPGLGLTKIA